jgi:hypothetical protein
MERIQGEHEAYNKYRTNDYFKEASGISVNPSDFQLILRMTACALALGTLILIIS